MTRFVVLRFALVSALAAAFVACASGTTNSGDTDPLGPSKSHGGAAGSAGGPMVLGGAAGVANGAGAHAGSGGGLSLGGSGGGVTTGTTTTLYAHTNDTLYELDPGTFDLTPKGKFDCIGGSGDDTSMNDVAVSKDGVLWGVSSKHVYKLEIGPSSVACTQTIPLNNPKGTTFYALTFAPAGVLDPSTEVLVAGNTAGELWAIDAAGNISQHGTMGTVPDQDGNGNAYKYPNGAFELSGDIVFLSNGSDPVGFATVRDCPSPPSSSGCNPTDTLIQIDVAALAGASTQSVRKAIRGQIVPSPQCTTGGQFGQMYGIAALGGSVYGFSHQGQIAIISNEDGTACAVGAMDPTTLWSGAGVTTSAMVTVPSVK